MDVNAKHINCFKLLNVSSHDYKTGLAHSGTFPSYAGSPGLRMKCSGLLTASDP